MSSVNRLIHKMSQRILSNNKTEKFISVGYAKFVSLSVIFDNLSSDD